MGRTTFETTQSRPGAQPIHNPFNPFNLPNIFHPPQRPQEQPFLTEDEQLAAALSASLEDARREDEKRAREEAELLAAFLAKQQAEEEQQQQRAAEEEDDEKKSELPLLGDEETPCGDEQGATSPPIGEEKEEKETVPMTIQIETSRFTMDWPDEHPVTVGLKNLGNSCFMNSSLQCLAHVAPVTQLFTQNGFHDKRTCPNSSFCALCECSQLFPKMAVNQENSKRILRPTKLFQNLPKINDCLHPGRQEDAHEFMSGLIDAWETALKEKKKNNNNNTPSKKDDEENNPITQLLMGTTRTTTFCGNCLAESHREEAFTMLSLDVASSLNESLTLFSTPEILRGDDAYFCDGCDSKKIGQKKSVLSRLPPVLMIHLKRFKIQMNKEDWTYTYSKVDEFESFPFGLKIGPFFVASDLMGQECDYELMGVLVHAGATLGCGHYYANVKGSDGCWYRCNDDRVTRVSGKQVAKEQAYILVYKRKTEIVQGGRVEETDGEEEAMSVCSTSESEDLLGHVRDGFFDGGADDQDEDVDSFERVPGLAWGDVSHEDWDAYFRGDWVL